MPQPKEYFDEVHQEDQVNVDDPKRWRDLILDATNAVFGIPMGIRDVEDGDENMAQFWEFVDHFYPIRTFQERYKERQWACVNMERMLANYRVSQVITQANSYVGEMNEAVRTRDFNKLRDNSRAYVDCLRSSAHELAIRIERDY